jgi:hypothetical protein
MSSLLESARRWAAAYRAAESFDSSLVGAGGDDVILAKLEECARARPLIRVEQEKIRELIAEARDTVERAAREYQHDYVEWHVRRAAEAAEERLKYFASLKDTDAEKALCASSTLHWFKYYAWGLDPRARSPLKVIPLVPFPRQETFILWLERKVFVTRSSGLVEKARDMGATENFLRWTVKHWLFTPAFSALLTSEKEDLVDSLKDTDTLFEKVRFQLRLTPSWMLPEGFDLLRDLNYMNISNPANGALLTGQAPTPNVGRQKRATVVLCDEFASWAGGGYAQDTSLSETSPSIFKVSSVKGKMNRFSDERHSGAADVFVMDWREHPFKDSRWYDSLPFGHLQKPMTSEEIAQEVDRDYQASQPGRVLKNVREEYCFITYSEFKAGFEAYGRRVVGDRPAVPDSWNWGRVADYGESARTEEDTHIWAYSLLARPPEDWPLNDSLFFFASLPVMPIGASELEGFGFYSKLERELGVRGSAGLLRLPSVNDMSHEAKDAKQVLSVKCGDFWNLPNLDFDAGRRKLVFHFEITDKHLPNPFRPVLSGRSRIYFVAPDDEYFLARNEGSASYFVTPSQTQRGFKRLRDEIPRWHYPVSERGKPVASMRPKAEFDDMITTVRYAAAKWGVPAAPMNAAQRRDAARPEHLRDSAVQRAQTQEEGGRIFMSQQVWDEERRREQERDRRNRAGGGFGWFKPPRLPVRPPDPFRRR